MNQIVAANAALGAKLFGQFAKTPPNANIVFSPLSITLALLLAHAGAEGTTASAIGETLGLGDATRAEAGSAAHALVQQLAKLDEQAEQRSGRMGETSDTVWLRIANALFVNNQVALRPAYETTVREQYAAQVEALDFGSPSAAPRIDAWVSEQTRGRIREIAGSLNRDVLAMLINAVYFKAPWADPFSDRATAEGDFHLLDGNTVRVPMMANTERQRYERREGYEIIGLPFGGANKLEFVVVLPNSGATYAAVQKAVAHPAFFSGIQMRPVQMRLKLPRFRVECDTTLNEPLQALGMGVAFDGQRADFSTMLQTDERIAISEVRHKTFLDVNEKGVEAAAATAIKMTRMSMAMETPIEVTVDRPFVCAIRDQESAALLFLGAIVQPGRR